MTPDQIADLWRLLDAIANSAKGSIGSIDNVYLCQISVEHEARARAALDCLSRERECALTTLEELAAQVRDRESRIKAIDRLSIETYHRAEAAEAEISRLRAALRWALKNLDSIVEVSDSGAFLRGGVELVGYGAAHDRAVAIADAALRETEEP